MFCFVVVFFYTCPIGPALNVLVHILFFVFLLENFIWGYSTSPTARTDNEGFQSRENCYSGARERVKSEKKIKHELSE